MLSNLESLILPIPQIIFCEWMEIHAKYVEWVMYVFIFLTVELAGAMLPPRMQQGLVPTIVLLAVREKLLE